jgi:dTDP-glucose 4,6-dehydratase
MRSWKDKTVIITGGAGFIGSHLVDTLLENGARTIVIDKLSEDTGINMRNHLEKYSENLRFMNLDVASEEISLSETADCIFHLASYAVPTLCESNVAEAFRTNVKGTFKVLKFASTCRARKVVFTSSALLYGREPVYLPIDEKHPIKPTESVYCITKKLGEDLCTVFAETDGLSISIARLFNTFGPRQTDDYLIPTIIKQAMEKGRVELWSDKPTRDLNFVQNTVEALMAIGASDIKDNLFNVGSGIETSVKDVAEKIAKEFNADLEFLGKDVIGSLRLRCDNRLIQERLGWRPKISFDEGINQTLQWYKSQLINKRG